MTGIDRMIEVDDERDHPARQHAFEQFRIGHRVVGVRLELDRNADPSRFVVGHGQDFLAMLASNPPADGE